MALQQKHRTRLYDHLVTQVGEETAEAVLGQFPARDVDEPVTKEFVALEAADLRSQIAASKADLRAEIAELGTEVRAEIAASKADLRAEIAASKADLRAEIAALRTEMRSGFGQIRIEMAAMELRLNDRINGQFDRVVKRLQVEGAIAVVVLAVVNALVG